MKEHIEDVLIGGRPMSKNELKTKQQNKFQLTDQANNYLKVLAHQLNKSINEIINEAIINYFESFASSNDELNYSIFRLRNIIYMIDNYINSKETLYGITSSKPKELNVQTSIVHDDSSLDKFISIKEKLLSLRKKYVREYKICRAILIKLNINQSFKNINISNVSDEIINKYKEYEDVVSSLLKEEKE